MNCEAAAKQLSLLLYGELSFDEEEAVQQHLDSCGSCRTELGETRKLHQLIDAGEQDAPEQLLSDSRRNLRIAVSALSDAGVHPAARSSFLNRLTAGWGQVWKPAGAVALLAAGFLSGRLLPGGGDTVRLQSASDPVASRVRFVQPEESGRVQIVVEEVRQRVLRGGIGDDHIRGLLLTAAREANDPGVRVETMDLLKNQSASSEVRRALLSALQHDNNAGVRLKALEALRSNMNDGETRRVLAQVLLTDQNPGVRTQAVDLLTQAREPAMAGVLQELLSREQNNYVRLKCQNALRDMNASVETF